MREKIKIVFLLLGLLLIQVNYLLAQTETKKYLIFTFEDKMSNGLHGTQNYYWILPIDSIEKNNFDLSHLFVNVYSNKKIKDCCANLPMDPNILESKTEKVYDSNYRAKIHILDELIYNKRKQIQTVTKTWLEGRKETISIYITPVQGIFCSCEFHPWGEERTGYKGRVSVPVSTFSEYQKFWNIPLAKIILGQDFSSTNFKIIPY